MITNSTQLNAVIGLPIGHSKSPVLHNALYQKLGIDAAMLAFSHKSIAQLVSSIRTFNIGLTAVTMPFKQSVIPLLDSVDKGAKAIRAVNTVINRNGKLIGYNTDIDGITAALKGVKISGNNTLIIGAGGAARATACYLKLQNGKIFYLNRTKGKARLLKKDFGGKVINYENLGNHRFDIIINCTSLGMSPKTSASPLEKKYLRKRQTVFDLVYNPVNTELLKDAKKAGARTISGIEMFVGQALRQIELYSGKRVSNSKIYNFAKGILFKSLQL